jgi:pimeloyl-ACP methyl ester carboxylesterase
LILADKLNINKFSIISQSGGCAYGFACAYAAPERILQLSVVSTLTPPDMAAGNKEVSLKTRFAISMLRKSPSWLLIKMYDKMNKTIKNNPDTFYNKAYKKASDVEKQILSTTDYYSVYTQTVLDALKNGSSGPVADIRLCFNPWGFDLSKISVPILIWHGQEDKSSPVQLVKAMQKTIKCCEARYIQGESHMSLLQNCAEEIFKVMSVKLNNLNQ